MGRANPLYSDFWGDPDSGNWDPFQKLLFLLLCSHPHGSVSGVYVCSVKNCSDLTGLPKKLVRHYLGVQRLSRAELRDAIIEAIDDWFDNDPEPYKNIVYDAENQTVFVKNLLSRMLGGRPEKIAISIMGDHRRTWKSKDLWESFSKRYRSRLTNPDHKYFRAELSRYIETALSMENTAPPEDIEDNLPIPDKRKREDAGNVEGEIQQMLNRYSIETEQDDGIMYRLDPDDRDMVFRVLRYVTTNVRTGDSLGKKRVHEILKRLDKEPTVLVARACLSFHESGGTETGKRANYLFGIVRNSALSWYVEWKNEMLKKKEFKLGNSRKKPKGRGKR